MAAADGQFAAALLEDRQRATDASGVDLSPAQQRVLQSVDEATLRGMVLGMAGTRMEQRRRAFLGRAAAAVAVLAGGAVLTGSGCRCAGPEAEVPAPAVEPAPTAEPGKPTFNAATAGKPTPMPPSEAIKHPGETTGIRPDTPVTPRGHAAPNVRVVLGLPRVKGNLNPEMVRRLMVRHNSELIRCFDEERKQTPDLGGTMNVAFTVAPAGNVTACDKVSSTVENAAMEACVVKAIRRWLFSKPGDGKAVEIKARYKFYRTRQSGKPGGRP